MRLLPALLIPLALLAAPACAENVRVGGVTVSAGWSRATPKGAPVGGGYMTIVNAGPKADLLVSAASPAAGKVELHRMSMDGGVMKMRAIPDGVEVPAGGKVVFDPSGLHLMLVDLKQPLVEGAHFPVTLTFRDAGAATVDFTVGGIGARSAPVAASPMDHMHAH